MDGPNIYDSMSVTDLYQAFKVHIMLYRNAMQTQADTEIIKEISKEMDIILDAMKVKLDANTIKFNEKHIELRPYKT